MSRLRSAPPPPSGAAPAWKLPPLRERLERARRPGASVSDMDLLVAGLAPDAVTEAMTPRERADLLLDILGDAGLGRRKDRQGRQVRHVAARALLALGYPYALELPPGAMPPTEHASRPSTSEPSPEREPLTDWNMAGLLLVLGTGVAEWQLLSRLFSTPAPPPRPPTLLPGQVLCVTSQLMTKSMLLDFIVGPSLALLALGTFITGLVVLLSLLLRHRGLLTASARAQWVGGAVRGGLSVLIGSLSAGLFRPEDPKGWALSIVLLTTGAVMGLAGFCFRPHPVADADAYATEDADGYATEDA